MHLPPDDVQAQPEQLVLCWEQGQAAFSSHHQRAVSLHKRLRECQQHTARTALLGELLPLPTGQPISQIFITSAC